MPYYLIPHTDARIWLRRSRRLDPDLTLTPWRMRPPEEPAPEEPAPPGADPDDDDEPDDWS